MMMMMMMMKRIPMRKMMMMKIMMMMMMKMTMMKMRSNPMRTMSNNHHKNLTLFSHATSISQYHQATHYYTFSIQTIFFINDVNSK